MDVRPIPAPSGARENFRGVLDVLPIAMATQKRFELRICLLGANTAPFLNAAGNPLAPARSRNAWVIGERTPVFLDLPADLFADAAEAILIHSVAPVKVSTHLDAPLACTMIVSAGQKMICALAYKPANGHGKNCPRALKPSRP